MKTQNKISVVVLTFAFVFALFGSGHAYAATTPSLGTASTFGLISNLFQHNATTTITGVVGNTLGVLGHSSKAGLGIINVSNGIEEADASAAWTAAGIAQGVALTNLNNQYLNSCTNIGETGNLDAIVINGGTPGHFTPGCYYRAGAMNIVTGGTVNLDGAGTYIFKSTGGAVTTEANTEVKLNNGASACDVFWTPVGATTFGANTIFKGTVLDAAGITMGDTVTWTGRALAYGGTVTSNGAISSVNAITVPSCSNPASLTVTKVVINASSGNKVVADFPLFVGATSVVSAILNNFAAGTYAITETTNSNYTQSFSGDCVSGNVTLASGGSYSCTITNHDIAQSMTGGGSSQGPTTVAQANASIAAASTTTTTTTTTFVPPPYFYIPSFPNTGFAPSEQNNLPTFLGLIALVSVSLVIVSIKKRVI